MPFINLLFTRHTICFYSPIGTTNPSLLFLALLTRVEQSLDSRLQEAMTYIMDIFLVHTYLFLPSLPLTKKPKKNKKIKQRKKTIAAVFGVVGSGGCIPVFSSAGGDGEYYGIFLDLFLPLSPAPPNPLFHRYKKTIFFLKFGDYPIAAVFGTGDS
jgi:hypothetical protein